jgi:hypothetical protein
MDGHGDIVGTCWPAVGLGVSVEWDASSLIAQAHPGSYARRS